MTQNMKPAPKQADNGATAGPLRRTMTMMHTALRLCRHSTLAMRNNCLQIEAPDDETPVTREATMQ